MKYVIQHVYISHHCTDIMWWLNAGIPNQRGDQPFLNWCPGYRLSSLASVENTMSSSTQPMSTLTRWHHILLWSHLKAIWTGIGVPERSMNHVMGERGQHASSSLLYCMSLYTLDTILSLSKHSHESEGRKSAEWFGEPLGQRSIGEVLHSSPFSIVLCSSWMSNNAKGCRSEEWTAHTVVEWTYWVTKLGVHISDICHLQDP